MRMLFVPILALALPFLTACADDKKVTEDKPAVDSRREKFESLKTGFEDEQKAILKRFQAADGDDRDKLRTEAKELFLITAGKALRIAQENPKDEVGLEASVFAASQLIAFKLKGDDLDKAVALITEHHLNNPKIKSLLRMMANGGEAGQKFLKVVAEKSTEPEVKGVALYMLGTSLAEQADEQADEKQAEALTQQAIDYLERAVKDAGSVKLGNEGTLAEAVEGTLVALKTLSIGKPAPEVTGTDLKTGRKVKLSDYKGKVVLLDIWATWCGPCKAMIPHERELVKRLKDKPFMLLSVSADDEKETLEEFLAKTEMPWTHWWDGRESEVLKKYNVRGFPTLYLIDAQGIIRKKFVGAPPEEVLDKAVEDALGKAGQ